jgi:hypothetical protein
MRRHHPGLGRDAVPESTKLLHDRVPGVAMPSSREVSDVLQEHHSRTSGFQDLQNVSEDGSPRLLDAELQARFRERLAWEASCKNRVLWDQAWITAEVPDVRNERHVSRLSLPPVQVVDLTTPGVNLTDQRASTAQTREGGMEAAYPGKQISERKSHVVEP